MGGAWRADCLKEMVSIEEGYLKVDFQVAFDVFTLFSLVWLPIRQGWRQWR